MSWVKRTLLRVAGGPVYRFGSILSIPYLICSTGDRFEHERADVVAYIFVASVIFWPIFVPIHLSLDAVELYEREFD
jgi:hypothetical protein